MTKEERLYWLKEIEKDIYVCSLDSTFSDDAKSCAIHSAIEELESKQNDVLPPLDDGGCIGPKVQLFATIKGNWIRWYEDIYYETYSEHIPHCKCSNCNKEYDPYASRFIKYCSNCGARMEEIHGEV